MSSLLFNILRSLIVVALLGAVALTAHANVLTTYQGRLTDASGTPLPDGDYEVMFSLYDDLSVVTASWTETHTVSLKDGLFSTTLGTITPLGEDLLALPGERYVDDMGRRISVAVVGNPESPRVMVTGGFFAAVASRVRGDFESDPGELIVSKPGAQGYTRLSWAAMSLFGDQSSTFPSVEVSVGPGAVPVIQLIKSQTAPGVAMEVNGNGMAMDFDEDGNYNWIQDQYGVWHDLNDDGSAEIEFYGFGGPSAFFTTGPNVTQDFLGPTNFGNRTRVDLCPAVPGFEIDFVNGAPPCNGARADFNVPVNIVGDVIVTGNHTVSGTKSFAQDHPMLPDKQIVYVSLEGNEAGTYTRGSGRLAAGSAEVTLPEDFGFVTGTEGLTAQITPRGPVQSMLYVESVSPRRLVVRASSGADRDVPFDFLVQGVRLGYEDHQVIRDKPQPSESSDDGKQMPPPPQRPRTFGTPGR